MLYKIIYQGKEIEIERLSNGKFKIPPLGQFTKHGLGSTWLDSCRIPYGSEGDLERAWNDGNARQEGITGIKPMRIVSPQGRFPANLLVSDDVLNDGRVSKSRASGYNFEDSHNDNPTHIAHNIKSGQHFADSGSFSRYFDLDKWWEERIKELPEPMQKVFPFLVVPKASKSEKNKGLEKMPRRKVDPTGSGYHSDWEQKSVANFHPSVKPIKLMSYLITLGSRDGDIVLDPFAGTSSTGIAAEMLNREWIMIEMDENYCEIGKRRIGAVKQKDVEIVKLNNSIITSTKVEDDVKNCQQCDLKNNRVNVVSGIGKQDAKIMFVGEAPGKNEDEQGEPFVGDAGKYLDKLLEEIKLKREDIYITNVIKCRPPNNRDPLVGEIKACEKWLKQEINMIKPKIIVLLGRVSLSYFFSELKISEMHGKAKVRDDIIYFFMYHPAAALYNPDLEGIIENDFRRLSLVIDKHLF